MDSIVRNKTILVTGAAGFVGRHLVEALADTNTVIAVDHFRTNARDAIHDDAIIVEGDVRDSATFDSELDDVDLIFHQAAKGRQFSIKHPAHAADVNVTATLDLLEFARETDARIILPSSAAVYGDTGSLPVPETALKRPVSPYGIQKLAVDQYGRQWHDLYDVETVVLRYFNVYGERRDGDGFRGTVGTFVEQARTDGQITIEGDGKQVRDFVHVSDVVQANLLAATTEYVGRAYNVGSSTGTTIDRLARSIRARVNPDATIRYTEPDPGCVQQSQADIARAQKLLDYEPTVQLEPWLRRLDASVPQQ